MLLDQALSEAADYKSQLQEGQQKRLQLEGQLTQAPCLLVFISTNCILSDNQLFFPHPLHVYYCSGLFGSGWGSYGLIDVCVCVIFLFSLVTLCVFVCVCVEAKCSF